MGEFFQQRSEDIRKLIPNRSPEKTHDPVPLVENSFSNITENINRDSLSVSEIVKVLSSESNTNVNAMISYLTKYKKTSNKENVSPNRTSLLSSKTLPDISPNSTTSQIASSSEKDISPTVRHDKTMSSLRSGSAMSSLPDGKLPLETTRTQLVWGCVKLGKGSIQEFVVRNRSQHRLRIQVS